MEERTGLITMQGNPLTLMGSPVATLESARDFTVMNTRMKLQKKEPLSLRQLP